VVGCALVGGVVRPVRAESPPDARATARSLADEGANAYAAGDYPRALALFGSARGLVPAPTIALFEARTLVQLGRWRDARVAYLRLIGTEASPDAPAPFGAAVEAGRAELAWLEPRIPRFRIVVTGGEVGKDGVVLLDERPLASPVPSGWLLVDPGAHSLRLRTARGSSAAVELVIAEGEARQVRFDVAPVPTATSSPARTWAFVSLGVGGAGIALGIAAGMVALDAHEEAERGCPANRCIAGTPGASSLERFRDWRTVSTAGYVVGAIGAGAGVALLLTSERARGPQVAIVPTLSGARLETAW